MEHMKKRLTSLVLVLALTLTLFAGLGATASAATFSGGSGTRNDPYLIGTAAELAAFRDLVNGGQSSLSAKLIADIDLGGQSWEPIGLTKTGYTGAFDGCGHLVSNVYIDTLSSKISIVQHGHRGAECQQQRRTLSGQSGGHHLWYRGGVLLHL